MRLFLIFAILLAIYNKANGKVSLEEIDVKLKTLNKPAVKTIKSEDGDIIDCIDIYKQHAFDHPALRNHKIQMKPSVEFVSENTTIPNNGSSEPIRSQIWSESGNCPIGTIPVRRVSKEDLSRASSLSQFGKKTHRKYNFLDKAFQRKTNFNFTAGKVHQPMPENRAEAILIALGFNFIGAQSHINVWNPPRVQPHDYSSAQIWLLSGLSGRIYDSIEAGWVVNPSVFGDTRTRLFIYWTIDAYISTGCFNLLCSGFVQTTNKIALGAAIKPVSSTPNKQYHISISLNLDPNSGNWWLTVQDIVVGYFPGPLFTSLGHSAEAVQWGGEVYSPNVKNKHRSHTKTSMGSGQWASHGYGHACFHTNIRIIDYSLMVKYPEYLSEYSDEYNCYSTKLHRRNPKTEPYFYFGGPGQNRRCI